VAKKKKKKRSTGAKKPTYAKGKKVDEPQKKQAPAARQSTGGTQGKSPGSQGKAGAKGESKPEVQQWNLVRKGTLEFKVMYVLLAIIAAAALLRYPLTSAEADLQYKESVKQYKQDLKDWEKKNPTPEQQKKNQKEKPVQPKKPTANVVLISVLFGALQSAIFAFLALNILRRTDLQSPVLDKTLSGGRLEWPDIRPLLTWSVPFGLVLLAPLYANAKISSNLVNTVFKAAESSGAKYPVWKEVLGSFNDAVFFWVLFVFTAVSAFIWLFIRYRDRTKVEPHWAGIAAAAALAFAFILLNVSSSSRSTGMHISGVTQALYALALAVPVLLLGYLFWKKGLEYSLLAGLIGFGLYPVMVSLIIK
jgi:hypothetical protein